MRSKVVWITNLHSINWNWNIMIRCIVLLEPQWFSSICYRNVITPTNKDNASLHNWIEVNFNNQSIQNQIKFVLVLVDIKTLEGAQIAQKVHGLSRYLINTGLNVKTSYLLEGAMERVELENDPL